MKHSELTIFYKILNYIISANIYPRRSVHYVPSKRAKLLYCIGKGIKIDLPKFIFSIILEASQLFGSGLPFGSFITKMARCLNIPIGPSEEDKYPKGPLTMSTIEKSLAISSFETAPHKEHQNEEDDIVRMSIEQEQPSATSEKHAILCQKIDKIELTLRASMSESNSRIGKLEETTNSCYEKISQMYDLLLPSSVPPPSSLLSLPPLPNSFNIDMM